MTDEQIDIAIEESFFGRVPCDGWTYAGAPFYGLQKNCSNNTEEEHNCYPRGNAPHYSRNPQASKVVRDKLAERWVEWDLSLVASSNRLTSGFLYEFSVSNGKHHESLGYEGYFADAETEERAVALCALKTVTHNGSSAA